MGKVALKTFDKKKKSALATRSSVTTKNFASPEVTGTVFAAVTVALSKLVTTSLPALPAESPSTERSVRSSTKKSKGSA